MKFVLLLSLVTLASSRPRKVNENEEAPWTLVSEHEGYDIREYPSQKWTCTSVVSEQFMTLFAYIAGENTGEEKVPMTKPVSSEKLPGSDMTATKTMCFYLPSAFQDNPPAPTNPQVQTVQFPTRQLAVRRFDGLASAERWDSEYKVLLEALASADVSVDGARVFYAGYNAPTEIFGRRNEIWIELSTAEKAEENEEAPWTLVAEREGFDVREYPSQKWTCTSVESNQFQTLFQYIAGGNEAAASIPMTRPVSQEKIPESGDMQQTKTMCFYVPSAFQDAPPTPNNPQVETVQFPTRQLAVRRFDGYATAAQWDAEYKSLMDALRAADVQVVDPKVFYAGYNAPNDLFDRRNEIWVQLSEENEEAPWTLVEEFEEFEVREYPSQKWTCTSSSNQFQKLFQYIDGQNAEEMAIPMTRPVTQEKIVDEGMEQTRTMCFYVPSAHQETPPAPTNPDVETVQVQTRRVAVRSFTEYASIVKLEQEYAALKSALDASGIPVEDGRVFYSGYQAPWVVIGRRNEIWIQL